MEAAKVEMRELLQKLFPKVSLPSNVVREMALPTLLLALGSFGPAALGRLEHFPTALSAPGFLQWDMSIFCR